MKDGLLDRLDKLEAAVTGLSKLIAAVARTVGTAEVQAEYAAGQRFEMEQLVTKAVDAGQIAPADVVGPNSLIIGRETTKDGQLVAPGRFQVLAKELADEPRVLLLGRKVGDKVEVPSGNTVEVDGIYDPAAPAKAKKKALKKKAPKKAPPAINAAVPYEPVN